jgi:hypothetical protein
VTIYLLLVWHVEFQKVLNIFLYDNLEPALRMGAEFNTELDEDGNQKQVCTVVEGAIA